MVTRRIRHKLTVTQEQRESGLSICAHNAFPCVHSPTRALMRATHCGVVFCWGVGAALAVLDQLFDPLITGRKRFGIGIDWFFRLRKVNIRIRRFSRGGLYTAFRPGIDNNQVVPERHTNSTSAEDNLSTRYCYLKQSRWFAISQKCLACFA